MSAKLLLADNKRNDLANWSKSLRNLGYEVKPANSIRVAQRSFTEDSIDLAVVDLRMQDDENPKDRSGLELAKEFARTVPVILLAAKPDWEVIHKAVRALDRDRAGRIDLVAKSEGPEELVRVIQKKLVPRIFIVHGHDDVARMETVGFVQAIGLDPVVLEPLAGKGQTIIEKFEGSSNVAYALVLLTPDDVGGTAVDPPELKLRARQNVIFELGFFIGRLGRERVTVLRKGEVEIPSNYKGVQYLPLDDGGAWWMQVAKAIESAHIKVNWDGLKRR